MKSVGMPMGMWILFRKSFRDRLVSVLRFNEAEAAQTAAIAKPKYREICNHMEKARSYIREHLAEKLTLTVVSRKPAM